MFLILYLCFYKNVCFCCKNQNWWKDSLAVFRDRVGFGFLVPNMEQGLPHSDALQSTDQPALNHSSLCSMCEHDRGSIGPVMPYVMSPCWCFTVFGVPFSSHVSISIRFSISISSEMWPSLLLAFADRGWAGIGERGESSPRHFCTFLRMTRWPFNTPPTH